MLPIAALAYLACAALSGPTTLLPVPAHVQRQPGTTSLSMPLVVDVRGPANQVYDAATDMPPQVAHALDRLQAFLAVPTGGQGPTGAQVIPGSGAVLHVVVQAKGHPVPLLFDSEAYSLTFTDAAVVLHTETPLGVVRGLETLKQWLQFRGGRWMAERGTIVDRPRFAWRGLMIDAARHFMPAKVIKKELEAMAAVKLNVLHWHLSDDQGFRIESRAWPKLHQLASGGAYYTHDEIRDVVAYAAVLGIRVVPEFDMPGHVDAWLLAYPELGAGPAPSKLGERWGILHSVLDPTRPELYPFLDALIAEWATLFPDQFIHFGGDENTGKQWQEAPHILAYMQANKLADSAALQAHFMDRVVALAALHNKSAVGWDEILHPGLALRPVVQSWRGGESLRHATDAGHQSLLSHGYYLQKSTAAHYLNDPADAYAQEPPPELLGGEACQWTELVPPAMLDQSLWPRTAAVAERLWSPRAIRDLPDVYRRLDVHEARLDALGCSPHAFRRNVFARLVPAPHQAILEELAGWLVSQRENWWPNFRYKKEFDHFADALLPESVLGRQLDEAVQRALNTELAAGERRRARHKVAADLRRVVAAAEDAVRLGAAYGSIADAVVLAGQAKALAQTGLEALQLVHQGVQAPPGFAARAQAELDGALNRELGAAVALAPGVARLVAEVATLGP